MQQQQQTQQQQASNAWLDPLNVEILSIALPVSTAAAVVRDSGGPLWKLRVWFGLLIG